MEIKITGIDKLVSKMEGMAKEIPFAVAGALNSTIIQVHQEEQSEMSNVFDRPTPFTLRGVLYEKATKQNMIATVFIGTGSSAVGRSESREYLIPQIMGGERKEKASERQLHATGILPQGKYIVPANNQLDQYGNIPGPRMVQILSAISGFTEQGYLMNRTATSLRRKLAAGQKPKDYFVKHNRAGVPIGIFFRNNSTAPGLSVLFFTQKPSYRKRYDFVNTAKKIIEKNWLENFTNSLRYAISTAKK
jgi:hypothetical protein